MALETDKNSPSPSSRTKKLRILDLCTGTGCIALLLHALLVSHFNPIQVMGIDISPIALKLARRNLEHNIRLDVLDSCARMDVRFCRADVLRRNSNGNATTSTSGTNVSGSAIPTVEELLLSKLATQSDPEPESNGDTPTLPKIDLLISNPPYISTTDFHNGTTARSVRLFEPRLALVPPTDTTTTRPSTSTIGQGDKPEDIFYRRILELSLDVRASITVLECGDRMQAERVVEMVRGMSLGVGLGGGGGEDGEERGGLKAEVWPDTEEDCLANGFHGRDGSRCVIIRRG
jgi:methylase of polypeptide subunit release factors